MTATRTSPVPRPARRARGVSARTPSRPRAASGARIAHVHVDNTRDLDQVFWVTPERWKAACRRHPAVGRRLRPTFGWDLEGFDEAMATAEVLVGWEFHQRDLKGRAPHLRWVHLTGAGLEHLAPFDWVDRHVVLTNNSGVHGPKAAEYAAMAILMLNNRIPAHVTNQRRSRWEQFFPDTVEGKTLLIIGVGSMGIAAAERAKALGMRVLGVRRSGRPTRFVDRMHTPAALDRLLPRADVVLVTAPLTPETRGLLDARRLDLMRPGAGLINMGRAGIVDYAALADRLCSGRLGGAVLDVFDPEPLPPDSFLWQTPNLIMTPHCSSDAPDYADRTLDLFFAEMARYLAGRRPVNAVDRRLQY